MKEKDEIKELFKESLENYSSNVDPSVWNAVQAGIGNAAAASGGSGFLAGVSSTAKIVSSVIVASSIITATAIYILSDDASKKENTIENSIIEQTKEDKREDSLVQENEDENSVSNDNRQTENISKIDNSEIVDDTIESKEGQEATDSSNKQDDTQLPDTKNSGHNSSGSVFTSETSTNSETPSVTQKTEQTSSSASTEADTSSPVELESEEPFQLNVVFEQLRKQQIRIELETSELDDFWIDVGDGTEFRSDIVEHWYEEAGEYEILVTGKIGEEYYYETHLVKVEVVGKINNLPNVFTPDGDGLNDYLFIDSEGLTAFQITVFNSKREVVYESNDVDFKWYGEDLRSQQKVEKGNYYYIIIARDKLGNVIHKHQTLSVIY